MAERLGSDIAAVRRLTDDGLLYTFLAHGQERYPTWQFTEDPAAPLLPDLEHLIAAFPAGMGASTIRGFMSTPQRGARINGVPMTPVEWLRRAGEPATLRPCETSSTGS